VTLITGASRGIGRVIATAFAEAGARLVLTSRSSADVENVASQIRASGGEAHAFGCDLTKRDDVSELVSRSVDTFGRVDVLINNAGIFNNVLALETTEDDWDEMMDANLKGLFFCCQEVGQTMRSNGGGRIINVSSCLARVSQSGYACYGASKAAVEQLTRVLALEWAEYGITVNAIAPTSTVTEASHERLSKPEFVQQAAERIPLGRFGEPNDLVGAAMYLSSPASSFVTGQTLVIDGGFSLGIR
jgi:NAD(P)-dependent dehydrogenase (short-subunit alcohol dehydrogenase family)